MPEPLLLLPGMGCTAALWAPATARLRKRAEDSSEPIVPLELTGTTVDGCVADVLAAAPDRFALAGLSLGGIIAMAVVRQAPERVTRLGLLDTNARAPTPAQQEGWVATRKALASGAGAREVQRELLPGLLSPAARPRLDDSVLAMADAVGRGGFDAQLQTQQSRVDERMDLTRIRVPTVVITGELDALCPLDRHTEIAAFVPRATLHVLPGVGHLSPLEAPDAVAELLGGWWRR